jgi:hypothetical protein
MTFAPLELPNMPTATTPSKLLVAFPLYKSVSTAFFAGWLDVDKRHVQGTVHVNGAYITKAFTSLVYKALTLRPWDRLVFIEQDMILPAHALVRMAHYLPEQAVVGSVYCRHEPPHEPLAFWEQNSRFVPLTARQVSERSDPPALHPVDAVGTGSTSIARHVLEHWHPDVEMFANDRLGHDFWFCQQARAQGHGVFLDTGIQCQHLSEVPVTFKDAKRYE